MSAPAISQVAAINQRTGPKRADMGPAARKRSKARLRFHMSAASPSSRVAARVLDTIPKDVVAKINAEALKVMKTEEYQRVLKDTGSEFVGDTPENFNAFVKTESEKWGKVAKATGAKVD